MNDLQCVRYCNDVHDNIDVDIDSILDELKEDFTEDDVLRWLQNDVEDEDVPEHRYYAAYVCMVRDLDLNYKHSENDYEIAVFSCACEHFDRVAASEEVNASEFLVSQLGRGGTDFW